MRSIITPLLTLVTLQTMAQSITGKLIDEKQRPIPFANVAVLSANDSTLIGGTTSNAEGVFSIAEVRQGSILRVSSVGYKSQFIVYNGTSPITITLNEDSQLLGEVVVKSKLPKMVFKGEGIITTVAGSVLERTISMECLLDLIPNVSAKDGSVKVLGRGSPEIYINGRKMRDRMELERLKPDEIKNIEVITNPGTRYNANVKSVIRIITKKPVGQGFSIDTKTVAR